MGIHQFWIAGTQPVYTAMNVSDYITDMSEVQFYARNEDYTLVIDDMDFKISGNYTEKYPDKYFVVGDAVTVYTDVSGSEFTLLYSGNISSKTYNYKTYEYKIQVEHKFQALKNFTIGGPWSEFGIDYDFWTELTESCEYIEVYNSNVPAPFIKIDNLYTFLFGIADITLDWTKRDATEKFYNVPYVSGTWHPNGANDYVTWEPENTASVSVSDLFIYANQLMAINQKYPYNFRKIEEDNDLIANRVSFYELISKLNQITGYVFTPKTTSEFYVVNSRFAPTRDVNTEIEYNQYNIEQARNGVKLDYQVPKRTRSNIPENISWAVYSFIPWNWDLYSPMNAWYSTYTTGDSEITSSVSSVGVNPSSTSDIQKISWIDQLQFFALPSRSVDDTHCQIFMPSLINQDDGLLSRPTVALLGSADVREYEGKINTEYKAAIENYITINNIDGGKLTSKIKTATYTYTP